MNQGINQALSQGQANSQNQLFEQVQNSTQNQVPTQDNNSSNNQVGANNFNDFATKMVVNFETTPIVDVVNYILSYKYGFRK